MGTFNHQCNWWACQVGSLYLTHCLGCHYSVYPFLDSSKFKNDQYDLFRPMLSIHHLSHYVRCKSFVTSWWLYTLSPAFHFNFSCTFSDLLLYTDKLDDNRKHIHEFNPFEVFLIGDAGYSSEPDTRVVRGNWSQPDTRVGFILMICPLIQTGWSSKHSDVQLQGLTYPHLNTRRLIPHLEYLCIHLKQYSKVACV